MFWFAGPAQTPDTGASLAPPLPDPTLPQPGNANCGWVVLHCRCSIGRRVSGVAQERLVVNVPRDACLSVAYAMSRLAVNITLLVVSAVCNGRSHMQDQPGRATMPEHIHRPHFPPEHSQQRQQFNHVQVNLKDSCMSDRSIYFSDAKKEVVKGHVMCSTPVETSFRLQSEELR